MLFIFYILLSKSECLHEYAQSHISQYKSEFNMKKIESFDQNRKQIRLVFDTGLIEDRTDDKMCKYQGEVISWFLFKDPVVCTQKDLVTNQMFKVINETLSNVKSYIESILMVNRLTAPIDLLPIRDVNITNKQSESDLHVAVVARPFGTVSSAQAVAIHHQQSESNKRPITGAIFINPTRIPEQSQSLASIPRDFFETLLHELCHILGISSSLFGHWIDPSTDLQYSEFPASVHIDPKYPNKSYHLIHTQQASLFVQERFGITEFAPGIPAGIEFEPGLSGTKVDSHPSSRVYFSELMGSVYLGKRVISNLTLSLLQDTGWYNVKRIDAEPLYWGDGKSILSTPIKSFLSGPPQVSFPRHYLCWPNESKNQCFYDYSGPALCSSTVKVNCSANEETKSGFCTSKDFYNPQELDQRGTSNIFDYMMVKSLYRFRQCTDSSLTSSEKAENGETYGMKSFCAISTLKKGNSSNESFPRCFEMLCSPFNHLLIKVNGDYKLCSTENQEVMYKGYQGSIKCPNPKHICGIIRVHDDSFSKKVFLLLSISFFFMVLLICSIILCIYCYNHKQKELIDERTMDLPLVA